MQDIIKQLSLNFHMPFHTTNAAENIEELRLLSTRPMVIFLTETTRLPAKIHNLGGIAISGNRLIPVWKRGVVEYEMEEISSLE
ncbi:hypothetical protein, partial [Rosenbergiella nectarea]|uniref:hypothetical protein n=1 Tax=Rosenbergiella nectarea TaxID=988801 RepID=UPI001F4E9D66